VRLYEEVKVPAGVFKAYKMEQNWSRLLPSGPVRGRKVEWRITVWYAPDVKSNVKFATGVGRTGPIFYRKIQSSYSARHSLSSELIS